MADLATVVGSADALTVHQIKEWGEILTDWETRNRYEIVDPQGGRLIAGELSGGFGGFVARSVLKNKRPFTIEVRDAQGVLLMTLRRPWRWFFSRLEVLDAHGRPLGAVQQRFAVLRKRYDLEGPRGEVFGQLQGPLLKPWTFNILHGEQPVGAIRKQWSGLMKEAFSDADTFGIELGDGLDANQRAVCVGATFLIDFMYFEDSN